MDKYPEPIYKVGDKLVVTVAALEDNGDGGGCCGYTLDPLGWFCPIEYQDRLVPLKEVKHG